MTVQKNFNWFNIIGFTWGLIGILCSLPAIVVFAFFDHGSGSKFMDGVFILSALSFPIVSFVTGIAILLLNKKHQKLAFFASFAPFLPLLPIFLMWLFSSFGNLFTCGAIECSSGLNAQKNSMPIQPCTNPLPDFSDKLTTTGCGDLISEWIGKGKINSTSEAQNWQFSAPGTYQFVISLKNDSSSCPQVSVFDTSGKLVNGFPLDNKPVPCLTQNSTTHFYYFTPPTPGLYILRVIAPITPGDYWINIQ